MRSAILSLAAVALLSGTAVAETNVDTLAKIVAVQEAVIAKQQASINDLTNQIATIKNELKAETTAGYVTKDAVTTTLKGYATTDSLAKYATTQSLSAYALRSNTVTSDNGQYSVTVQDDGNFVYHAPNGAASILKSTDRIDRLISSDGRSSVFLQNDGNLVHSNGGSFLNSRDPIDHIDSLNRQYHITIQDDGNFVIYHNGLGKSVATQ